MQQLVHRFDEAVVFPEAGAIEAEDLSTAPPAQIRGTTGPIHDEDIGKGRDVGLVKIDEGDARHLRLRDRKKALKLFVLQEAQYPNVLYTLSRQ